MVNIGLVSLPSGGVHLRTDRAYRDIQNRHKPRVRAALQFAAVLYGQHSDGGVMIYLFDEFSIDDQGCELRRRGELVKIERRIFDLILILLENRERVMLKAEIFARLWEGRRVSESSLTVAMTAARKALGDSAEPHRILRTQHGRGYRFVADVSTLDASSDYRPAIPHGTGTGLFRDFVGRRQELGTLFDAYAEIQQSRRRVVLISGEPGIGKSRLLGEFAGKAAHRGAVVLMSKCMEQDGSPPYWPWIQILKNALANPALGASLRDPVCIALSLMSPEETDAHGLEVAGGDASRARFRLFDLVRQVVTDISGVFPVLVCIDDVHRSDPASLLLLEFVAEQAERERLMIVLADRDSETRRSPLHAAHLARVCGLGGSSGILLRGLAEDDIAGLLPKGSDASSLWDLTGGNPFFLSQLLPIVNDGSHSPNTSFRSRLPFSIGEAIGRHLEGLSGSSRKVLDFAAVIGREFDEGLLRLATGNSVHVEELIAEAASARLLEARQSNRSEFRFVHALIRELIYESMEPSKRLEYHRAIALALERRHGAAGGSAVSEYAFHMYRSASADSSLRCVEACMAAGSYASAQLAYEDAAVQYSRALELATVHLPAEVALHCDIYLGLGMEISRTGDRAGARIHFMRAVALARSIQDSARLAHAAMACFPGFFAVEAGAPDIEVIALLREAIAGVQGGELRLRALLQSRLAMAIAWYERGYERRSLCIEASKLAKLVGDPGLEVQVLLARWFAEWDPTEFEKRWSIAQDLISRARLVGDTETLLLCRLFWVTCLLERGEISEFRRESGVFQDAADRLRQPEALWYAALLRAVDALHSGRLVEAEKHSAAFFSIGRLVGDANVFHSRMGQRFLIAREQGEWDLLVRIASEAVDAYPGVVGWRATKAWALSEAGRLEEARREFLPLARSGFENIPRRMDWSVTMALLSEVAVALGAREEGDALYALMKPLRGRLIVLGLCVLTWGCGSQFLGRLRILSGRLDEGVVLLEEAVAVEDAVGARAWAARSRLALAEALKDPTMMRSQWSRAEVIQGCREAAESLGLVDLNRRLSALD